MITICGKEISVEEEDSLKRCINQKIGRCQYVLDHQGRYNEETLAFSKANVKALKSIMEKMR